MPFNLPIITREYVNLNEFPYSNSANFISCGRLDQFICSLTELVDQAFDLHLLSQAPLEILENTEIILNVQSILFSKEYKNIDVQLKNLNALLNINLSNGYKLSHYINGNALETVFISLVTATNNLEALLAEIANNTPCLPHGTPNPSHHYPKKKVPAAFNEVKKHELHLLEMCSSLEALVIEPRQYPSLYNTITLGDAHANPLKIVYSLLREGIVTLSPERYKELANCYNTYGEITTKLNTLRQQQSELTDALVAISQDESGTEFDLGMFSPPLMMFSSTAASSFPNKSNLLPEPDEENEQNTEENLKALTSQIESLVNEEKRLINEFISLLDSLEPTSSTPKRVRLLGDLLADRGFNDLFILELLNILKNKLKIDFSINISNHDLFFITYLYNGCIVDEGLRYNLLNNNQGLSLNNFDHFYKQLSDTEKNRIQTIINEVYFPSLELFSQELSENQNTITLYSHAPCDYSELKVFCELLGDVADFKDETAFELAQTVDYINALFKEKIKQRSMDINELREMTLTIAWNRPTILSPTCPPFSQGTLKYPIRYVHGHTEHSLHQHSLCLDSPLGRPSEPIGELIILKSKARAVTPRALPTLIDVDPAATLATTNPRRFTLF